MGSVKFQTDFSRSRSKKNKNLGRKQGNEKRKLKIARKRKKCCSVSKTETKVLQQINKKTKKNCVNGNFFLKKRKKIYKKLKIIKFKKQNIYF